MSQASASPTTLNPDLARQMAALRDRFTAALAADQQIFPESLLGEVPAETQPELFRGLLLLEIEHRKQRGNPLLRIEAEARLADLAPWVGELLDQLFPTDNPTLTLAVLAGPLLGRSFVINGHSTYLVGRGPGGMQLAVPDEGMSRSHFLIEFNPPQAQLIDLRSKNGTFLNGLRITQAPLRDSDEIRAGQSRFGVQVSAGHHTVTVSHDHTASLFPEDRTPRLPGYEILAELGRGGMGVVYKARRLDDDAIVAIKMVLPAMAPQRDSFARFQREMAILARLTHPHIVGFLEACESGGSLYFVMEYIDGISAAHVVKRSGPLAPGRVVALGCQLLEALAHAHLQGFVHRDVKPGNLLLTRVDDQEILKLADFGLGRAYQASVMSGLTLSGQPGGPPGFMPPEQVSDFRSARPAADQYAAAATLYYLLTGQMIYERAVSAADLFVRIMTDEPIPLRNPASGPSLPGKFAEVLRRALARDPRQRFVDVLAFRDALVRAL